MKSKTSFGFVNALIFSLYYSVSFALFKMPSHSSLIVLIVAKDDKTSFAQGLAKYQLDQNVFQTIRWKYFYPFNKPRLEFSSGDILFFEGKFVIEDGSEYITVAYASLVSIGDPDDGFKADEIPLCIPHFMSPASVKHNSKLFNEKIYFVVECRVYNSFTAREVRMEIIVSYPAQATRFEHLKDRITVGRSFVVSGFIKFESNNITLEATDIDYLSSFNANYNLSNDALSINSNTSNLNSNSDINLIANEFKSTNSQPLRKRKLVPTSVNYNTNSSLNEMSQESMSVNAGVTPKQKRKKRLTDLALDSLGLNVNYSEDQIENLLSEDGEQYENSDQEDGQEERLESNEQEKNTKQVRKKYRRTNKGSMSKPVKRR